MTVLDDVLVGLAIVLLVARQFVWRDAEPGSLLRLPVIVLAVGVGWLAWELVRGEPLTWSGGGLLAAELVLVCGTGAVMGRVTTIATVRGRLRYRLTSWGLLLWAVFLAVRIGSFVLASVLGAHLLETTAAIVLSFGVNRLASSLVVRGRILRAAVREREPVG